MPFDGEFAQMETVRDGGIAASLGDEPQHFTLARAKRVQVRDPWRADERLEMLLECDRKYLERPGEPLDRFRPALHEMQPRAKGQLIDDARHQYLTGLRER